MDAPLLNNCSIFLDEADAENGSIRKPLPEIDGDSDNLDQLINDETRSLVKEFGANSAEFRSYLKSFDLTRLRFHNYDTFYLNLLSVFGNRLSYKEIEELAKKCTRFRVWNSWEYHYRIRSQVRQKAFAWNPRLNNWDTSRIDSLLARGKGLIIGTQHFGAFRDIASDLVLLGYRVLVAVDREMARFYNRFVEECRELSLKDMEGNPHPFVTHLRYTDVESGALNSIDIVSALRRNEIVLFFADGNSGADGRWGSNNKCVFPFLNRTISVRAGVVSTAMILQTPLLFLLTRYDADGSPEIALYEEIDLQRPRDSVERQDLERSYTRGLYSRLEEMIINHPVQWESASFFHRWYAKDLAPQPAANPNSVTSDQIVSLLEQGTSFRFDRQRVACIWMPKQGNLLMDIKTLVTYQLPDESRVLTEALNCDEGVDEAWFRTHSANQAVYDKQIRFLAKLHYLCETSFCRAGMVASPIKKGGELHGRTHRECESVGQFPS